MNHATFMDRGSTLLKEIYMYIDIYKHWYKMKDLSVFF